MHIIVELLVASVSFSVSLAYLAIVSPKRETPKPDPLPEDFKHLVLVKK